MNARPIVGQFALLCPLLVVSATVATASPNAVAAADDDADGGCGAWGGGVAEHT